MGSSTTEKSSGSGSRVPGDVRLFLGLIARLAAGFRASSWEAAASAAVEEDVARFQALELPLGPNSALAAEAVRLLRRRGELVREQARLSQLGSRWIAIIGIAAVVAALIANAALFGVDGAHRFSLLFDFWLVVLAAWLFVWLPLRLLRLLGPPSGWPWLAWVALALSAYVAGLWMLYSRVTPGSGPTGATADSATQLAATASALFAVSVFVLTLLAWSVWKVWIDVGLRRRWETSNPQATVVRGILLVLNILHRLRAGADIGDQSALDVTGFLWATVESTAETVEAGFGRVLDLRNSFEAETGDTVARIAAGLRALKWGVSVRGPLREEGLPVVDAEGLRRVESTFLAWAGGGLDDLPRAEPRRPQPARRRRGVLQQAAAAVAPLVVLLLVRIARLDLGTFGPLLVAVAIAWLISGLLYALLGDDLETYVQRASGWGKILGTAGSGGDAVNDRRG